MTYRIGFLTTHPIQYQVPVFRHLAQVPDFDFTVYYCQIPDAEAQGAGFGAAFNWDIPLLDGYQFEVLANKSRQPSVVEFGGCDTPEIYNLVRHGNFDAFVVNGWVVKSCLQTLWACRQAGVPCIVRGEANNIRPRAWWKRQLQRQLLKQYSAFLYIGQANADFYRSHGVPDHCLFPALYCIDNDRFSQVAAKIDRQQARDNFGLRPDSVVFLFSGKLTDKKHPLELLAALRRASESATNVECLIVGDGELRPQCEAYVKAYGLPVRFAGFLNQSEIVEAYVAADCLVLPSDHGETWGLVVNEAMVCGCPPIVSNQVGCYRDLVTSGVTGSVFEFGQWDQLSAILRDIAANPDIPKKWAQAARRRINDYSPQAAAHGIVEAVRTVRNKKAPALPTPNASAR